MAEHINAHQPTYTAKNRLNHQNHRAVRNSHDPAIPIHHPNRTGLTFAAAAIGTIVKTHRAKTSQYDAVFEITQRVSNHSPKEHPINRLEVIHSHDKGLTIIVFPEGLRTAIEPSRNTRPNERHHQEMRKKLLLAILLLTAIATVYAATVLFARQKDPEENTPAPVEQTKSCVETAAAAGIPRDRLTLIRRAQEDQITSLEAIKLRETLRRHELKQCESLYTYLLQR